MNTSKVFRNLFRGIPGYEDSDPRYAQEEEAPRYDRGTGGGERLFSYLKSQLAALPEMYANSGRGYGYERDYKSNLANVEQLFRALQGGTDNSFADYRSFSDKGAGGFRNNRPLDIDKAKSYDINTKGLSEFANKLPKGTENIDDFNFLNSFKSPNIGNIDINTQGLSGLAGLEGLGNIVI